MSRKKLKSRDRVTQKMSRDGVVERNAATGEEKRVSKREARLDLRGGAPERESYFQVGNRPDNRKSRKKAAYRQHKSAREPDSAAPQSAAPVFEVSKTDSPLMQGHEAATVAEQSETEQTAAAPAAARPRNADALNAPRNPANLPGIKPKKPRRQAYNHEPQSPTPENTPARENTAAWQDAQAVSEPRAAEPEAVYHTRVKPDDPTVSDSHIAQTGLEQPASALNADTKPGSRLKPISQANCNLRGKEPRRRQRKRSRPPRTVM